MGQPTCTFCGAAPDAVGDLECCRKCALRVLPRVIARACVGTTQAGLERRILESLLKDVMVAFWTEVAAMVEERHCESAK